jgi:hypothetical protein
MIKIHKTTILSPVFSIFNIIFNNGVLSTINKNYKLAEYSDPLSGKKLLVYANMLSFANCEMHLYIIVYLLRLSGTWIKHYFMIIVY